MASTFLIYIWQYLSKCKMVSFRNCLAVQWLGLAHCRGPALIPIQVTKIPKVTWCSSNKPKPTTKNVLILGPEFLLQRIHAGTSLVPVVKNLSPHAGDTGLIPGGGTKIPCAVGNKASRLQLEKPQHSKVRIL